MIDCSIKLMSNLLFYRIKAFRTVFTLKAHTIIAILTLLLNCSNNIRIISHSFDPFFIEISFVFL
jgi:hypothetical protein